VGPVVIAFVQPCGEGGAVNRARRHAWAQAGSLPPVRIADRDLKVVTCIRLDTAYPGRLR